MNNSNHRLNHKPRYNRKNNTSCYTKHHLHKPPRMQHCNTANQLQLQQQRQASYLWGTGGGGVRVRGEGLCGRSRSVVNLSGRTVESVSDQSAVTQWLKYGRTMMSQQQRWNYGTLRFHFWLKVFQFRRCNIKIKRCSCFKAFVPLACVVAWR